MEDNKICTKCLKPRFIVNKKYHLCDECNYKRLHNGKSKQEVYRERADARKSREGSTKVQSENRGALGQPKPRRDTSVDVLRKKYSIKDVSSTNKYLCTDGSRVTQAQINRRYAETCDRIKLEREPVCQGTGRTDLPLSFSHTISRKRCKELGRADLIWDPANIEIESYHEPSSNPIAAHNIWESGSWFQRAELLNIERKLEYIKINDPQTYGKTMATIDSELS